MLLCVMIMMMMLIGPVRVRSSTSHEARRLKRRCVLPPALIEFTLQFHANLIDTCTMWCQQRARGGAPVPSLASKTATHSDSSSSSSSKRFIAVLRFSPGNRWQRRRRRRDRDGSTRADCVSRHCVAPLIRALAFVSNCVRPNYVGVFVQIKFATSPHRGNGWQKRRLALAYIEYTCTDGRGVVANGVRWCWLSAKCREFMNGRELCANN